MKPFLGLIILLINFKRVLFPLPFLSSELLPGGGTRAVLITGSAKDTGRARDELSKALTDSPSLYLWVEIDGVINHSPETWTLILLNCSHFHVLVFKKLKIKFEKQKKTNMNPAASARMSLLFLDFHFDLYFD